MIGSSVGPGRRALLLIVAVAAVASFTPAMAQELMIKGSVVDAEGTPAAGHRVVFRQEDAPEIFISDPTDEAGEYRILLPAGQRMVPFSLILSSGKRFGLGDLPAMIASPGARMEIQLEVVLIPEYEWPRPGFQGADRLFLSFIEDPAIVDWLRAEGQLEYATAESEDRFVARYVTAAQFSGLPNVEFGARIGIASLDRTGGGPDGSGATDLDLWGKMVLRPGRSGLPSVAFGGEITLPTGDKNAGLSYDAFSSQLFGAARFLLPKGEISFHLGVRSTGAGEIAGIPLDGEVSGKAGLGYLVAVTPRLVLVAEAKYEGKRFESGEDDARLLFGVNWQPISAGVIRLALAGGLTDGAPDVQLLAGYSYDF